MKNGRYKTKDTVGWYFNDKLHREDGPAIEWLDGTKQWFIHDQKHRENGPAVEWSDGTKLWYFNDKLHREDGPAIEHSDSRRQWFLDGIEYTEDEFNQWLWKKALNEKLQCTLESRHKDKKSKI